MTRNQLIEEYKIYPVNVEFIADIQPIDLCKYVTAWTMSNPETSDLHQEKPDGVSKFQFLWDATSINYTEFTRLCGFIRHNNIIQRLIRANLIYPDGTYNKDFITDIMSPKEEE